MGPSRRITHTTEPPEEHELDFLEAFEAIGERVQWIPRGDPDPKRGRPPTNDFRWLTNGLVVCELKNSKPKYSSIADRIDDAVSNARDHATPVVRDRFIIHIDHRLTPKLLNQLRNYNLNRADAAIRQLWVFEIRSRTLTEVSLRAKYGGTRPPRS